MRDRQAMFMWLLGAIIMCLVLMPAGAAAQQADEAIPASRIIDRMLRDPQGMPLGEIEDLVVRRNGRVKTAVITVGGFMDIGEKYVAVPFSALVIGGEGNISRDTSKQSLMESPEFDYEKEGVFTGYHHIRYFRHPVPARERQQDGPTREGGRPPEPYPYTGSALPGFHYMPFAQPYGLYPGGEPYQGRYHPWDWAYFPSRFLATAAMGRSVINKEGQDVAEVEDLLINAEGRVSRLILAVGGVLEDAKQVAVPYAPLGFINWAVTYPITSRDVDKLPAYSYDEP